LNLLLDTHVLLWAAGEPEKLSARGRDLLLDTENLLHFSPANLWEIVIKSGLGRDDFQVDPRRLWRLLLANGYRELTVRSEHGLAVQDLPDHHRDPFDRLLLAQARVEGMDLVTADARLALYGAGVLSI
jgi:PIN domain nuclease of toxin-antitoxin system